MGAQLLQLAVLRIVVHCPCRTRVNLLHVATYGCPSNARANKRTNRWTSTLTDRKRHTAYSALCLRVCVCMCVDVRIYLRVIALGAK